MNGRALFDRLVSDLQAGREPPESVTKWLVDGKRRWERRTGATLEEALGLVRTRETVYLRDALVAQAVARMPDDWKTSEKIRQVRKIAKRLEPYRQNPDLFDWENAPDWYPEILSAMDYAPIPKPRQLRKVCTQTKECKKTSPIMNHPNFDQKET